MNIMLFMLFLLCLLFLFFIIFKATTFFPDTLKNEIDYLPFMMVRFILTFFIIFILLYSLRDKSARKKNYQAQNLYDDLIGLIGGPILLGGICWVIYWIITKYITPIINDE